MESEQKWEVWSQVLLIKWFPWKTYMDKRSYSSHFFLTLEAARGRHVLKIENIMKRCKWSMFFFFEIEKYTNKDIKRIQPVHQSIYM